MRKMCFLRKMIFSSICALVFVLLVSTECYAEEMTNLVQLRMAYISSYSTELVIADTGLATITGQVRGKSGVTNAYVKVTLQKYTNGNWKDVESWEDSRDGRNAFVSETYQVKHGKYRTVMTCSANTEVKTAISAERTY